MKTVVCRKTGNTKSISVESSYTVISETEKRYTLVNDKGIQANYCKSLFTEEVATPTRTRAPRVAAVPVAPAPVAVPNTQINEVDVTVSVNYDDEEYDAEKNEVNVSLVATTESGFRHENSITLEETFTSISCGIFQLTSLDSLCNTITLFKEQIFTRLNNLQNTDVNVSQDDINTADILESVINELVENAEDTGLLLLSTNVNSALTTPTYREVLDRMSANVIETLNPNSGNRIKLWTLQITE